MHFEKHKPSGASYRAGLEDTKNVGNPDSAIYKKRDSNTRQSANHDLDQCIPHTFT